MVDKFCFLFHSKFEKQMFISSESQNIKAQEKIYLIWDSDKDLVGLNKIQLDQLKNSLIIGLAETFIDSRGEFVLCNLKWLFK